VSANARTPLRQSAAVSPARVVWIATTAGIVSRNGQGKSRRPLHLQIGDIQVANERTRTQALALDLRGFVMLFSLVSAMQALRIETEPADPAPLELSKRIFVARRQRVLLDSDLSEIYGVNTLRLNLQVRRNADRFPDDFLLRLTNQEVAALRSHFAILKAGSSITARMY
jgi:hypothetical protein